MKAYFSFSALNSGFNIIESPHMTIVGRTKVIKLTRKWKPKRIKRITEIIPNPELMMMGNTIVGHPVTIAKLRGMVGVSFSEKERDASLSRAPGAALVPYPRAVH